MSGAAKALKWLGGPVFVGLIGYFVVGPRTKPPKDLPLPSAMSKVLGGPKPDPSANKPETPKPPETTPEAPAATNTPATGAPRVDVDVHPVSPATTAEERPRRRRSRRRRHRATSESKPAPRSEEPAAPSAPDPASNPDG